MTETQKREEELFCIKYELDALAGILLEGKAERWVPGFTGSNKDADHLNRYELACGYVKGLKVLDIACGAGKGSNLLATKGMAEEVTGGDIDSDAVRYASHRYGNNNLSFVRIDAANLDYKEEFDVVVSFETIEHVSDYKSFLKKIRTSLKDDGTFIVSTPVAAIPLDSSPLNSYHIQEWGFNMFHDIITGAGFAIEKIFIQMNLKLNGPSILERARKRFLYKKKNIKHFTGYEEKRLEEFVGQYKAAEFGITRNGFQIIICKKNE